MPRGEPTWTKLGLRIEEAVYNECQGRGYATITVRVIVHSDDVLRIVAWSEPQVQALEPAEVNGHLSNEEQEELIEHLAQKP